MKKLTFCNSDNMVEQFLPSQCRISLTSRRGLSKTKGQYDTALERKKYNKDPSFAKEGKDSNSPNYVFGSDVKRGFIQLGAQKRREGQGRSRPEEELSADNEDSIKEENEQHELCEQQVELGEYVELYDWRNGDQALLSEFLEGSLDNE